MNTLLLDQTSWDLLLDTNMNIAVASDPYSQAQDAASNIKLFQGELYYDTTQGVPYFQDILGQAPSLSVAKAQFVAAAKLVPGVTAAQCFVNAITNRKLSGQVQITDVTGATAVASF